MTIKVTYNVTDVYMSQSVSPVYINVSYSDGGASGGGVWGTITGTLSNQTDLQSALDGKLDESTIDGGAEGQILSKASATDFDFAWINNYAKYLATNVRNQSGSTIGAFQVVYISGATGNKPLISLADADTEATSSKTYGVTATSIANNSTGDVVTAGELSGIDTSAFNEGDLLWLSTTAGGVVTTPPAEPAHAVFIGYVVRSHPTLGVIDVAIANGYELNELHGVQITTPTDNQGLFYNSTSTLWENKTISTALGYTPANAATTLTINGVTYDLSQNRSWTVAAGLSGTIATGQVAFGTAADTIGGSNNLFWDSANGRLGIGTNTPTYTFHVSGANAGIFLTRSGLNDSFILLSNTTITTGGQIRGLYTSLGLRFTNALSDVEWARFNSTGNFSLGSTSDNGQRLQVYGDTLLRGSGNTSATTALTVQNSASSNLLRILNDGTHKIGGQNIDIYPSANGSTISNGGRGLIISTNASSQTDAGALKIIGGYSSALGSDYGIWVSHLFTNGTGGVAIHNGILLNQTINQTGGANGITRGLYVNPTLTAAADWRSIEWSNNTGWGLYGAGGASNYLSGRVGIGSSLPTASIYLSLTGQITGGVIAYGVRQTGFVRSDVTLQAIGIGNILNKSDANNLPAYFNFYAIGGGTISGTVTNEYGFAVSSAMTSATNSYGFHGDIPSGTGRWNIYMAGTADNYLAGNLGIGITPTVRLQVSGDTILKGSGATSSTTALTVQNSSSTNLFTVRNDGVMAQGGATASDVNFYMRKTLSGSVFPSGIYMASVVSSTSTTGAGYFATDATTQAASFTLPNLYHYFARQSAFGAGSTVTNQYGFTATSTLTGATNNYGFYGDIASGTGRWNLYMNGTADNYLAGDLGIGTTSVTNWLNIGASTTSKAHINLAAGSTPTAPANGDIWFDGTDIKMRIGGVTKTFTLI